MRTIKRNKMGRAGNGDKIHLIYNGVNISGIEYFGIECGADFSNGSGHGALSRVFELDLSKVTCKRCIARQTKFNHYHSVK